MNLSKLLNEQKAGREGISDGKRSSRSANSQSSSAVNSVSPELGLPTSRKHIDSQNGLVSPVRRLSYNGNQPSQNYHSQNGATNGTTSHKETFMPPINTDHRDNSHSQQRHRGHHSSSHSVPRHQHNVVSEVSSMINQIGVSDSSIHRNGHHNHRGGGFPSIPEYSNGSVANGVTSFPPTRNNVQISEYDLLTRYSGSHSHNQGYNNYDQEFSESNESVASTSSLEGIPIEVVQAAPIKKKQSKRLKASNTHWTPEDDCKLLEMVLSTLPRQNYTSYAIKLNKRDSQSVRYRWRKLVKKFEIEASGAGIDIEYDPPSSPDSTSDLRSSSNKALDRAVITSDVNANGNGNNKIQPQSKTKRR